MKVFATKVEGEKVVLVEWPSKKAFETVESWRDPKWISVATSEDLGFYKDPYEAGSVIYSQERIDSFNLMHDKYMTSAMGLGVYYKDRGKRPEETK